MIRKLASGQFRLYSRKTDPKTGKRKNLGTLKKPSSRGGSRTCGAVFQAALELSRPSHYPPQGGAGSTNALFSLHEGALA